MLIFNKISKGDVCLHGTEFKEIHGRMSFNKELVSKLYCKRVSFNKGLLSRCLPFMHVTGKSVLNM